MQILNCLRKNAKWSITNLILKVTSFSPEHGRSLVSDASFFCEFLNVRKYMYTSKSSNFLQLKIDFATNGILKIGTSPRIEGSNSAAPFRCTGNTDCGKECKYQNI